VMNRVITANPGLNEEEKGNAFFQTIDRIVVSSANIEVYGEDKAISFDKNGKRLRGEGQAQAEDSRELIKQYRRAKQSWRKAWRGIYNSSIFIILNEVKERDADFFPFKESDPKAYEAILGVFNQISFVRLITEALRSSSSLSDTVSTHYAAKIYELWLGKKLTYDMARQVVTNLGKTETAMAKALLSVLRSYTSNNSTKPRTAAKVSWMPDPRIFPESARAARYKAQAWKTSTDGQLVKGLVEGKVSHSGGSDCEADGVEGKVSHSGGSDGGVAGESHEFGGIDFGTSSDNVGTSSDNESDGSNKEKADNAGKLYTGQTHGQSHHGVHEVIMIEDGNDDVAGESHSGGSDGGVDSVEGKKGDDIAGESH
jgi:hypothetical protein